MSADKKPAQFADDLSFMRLTTKAEREVGAPPIDYWKVATTGTYSGDVALGKAIAEEFVDYLVANPTNGNMTLLGCMLVEMTRVGRRDQRGVMVGFASVVGKLAVLGATMFGADCVRRDQEEKRAHLVEDLHGGGQTDIAVALASGWLA